MSEVDEALAGVESMSVGTGFKEDFDGIIGIDLGTTYSCVAVWLDAEQRTEVFANAGVWVLVSTLGRVRARVCALCEHIRVESAGVESIRVEFFESPLCRGLLLSHKDYEPT